MLKARWLIKMLKRKFTTRRPKAAAGFAYDSMVL